MTSRPSPKLGRHLLPGLVAVLLFAVMAFVFLGPTSFAAAGMSPDAAGFPAETQVAAVEVADGGSPGDFAALECDGAIHAVEAPEAEGQQPSCENRVQEITGYTDASVQFEERDGAVYGVATVQNSVTESIGYALFNLNPYQGGGHSRAGIPTEGFLVALIAIAVLLDAALEGALMLAKREGDAGTLTALRTDGGDEGGDR